MCVQGTIPGSWESWAALTYLDCRLNQLSGSLPNNPPSDSQLTVLDLGHNSLTGSLPDGAQRSPRACCWWGMAVTFPCDFAGWSHYSSMRRLSLAYNQMNGSLPSSLSNMSYLTELYLDGNNFVGSIPVSWDTLNISCATVYGNLGLCGRFPASSSSSGLPCLDTLSTRLGKCLVGAVRIAFNLHLSQTYFTHLRRAHVTCSYNCFQFHLVLHLLAARCRHWMCRCNFSTIVPL
jgi:hypothetical protein